MSRNVSAVHRPAGESHAAAIVMGLGYGGLNAVRTLGRLGVEVHGVHRHSLAPAAQTRFLASLRVRDLETQSEDESVQWLCELAEELRNPVWVLMDDADVMFFARHRERLAPTLRYPFVPSDLVDRLVFKARLHELCREHGVPSLPTIAATSVDAALHFAHAVGYPLVVKGNAEAHRVVVVARDDSTLDAAVARALARNVVPIVQEALPWGRSCDWFFHGYFDRNSHCTFGMTGVKVLMHPRAGGPTVVGASVPNPELREQIASFLAGVGYRGIVGCCFRYDSRDGTYKLLDANPRVGANFRASVDTVGMDVVRALYFDLTGRAVEPGKPRVGRRWVRETSFLSTSEYVRSGVLSPRQWLGTLRGVEEVAWFARDDVRPFIAFLRSKIRGALTRGRRSRASG